MKKVLFGLMMFPVFVMAQSGVKFEHGTTWAQVREKAKAENKYIFMDAFTTWCGPCRYMAANIFPKEEVGNFFNDKFINLKVQLDTTMKDNEEVKSWYADVHSIMTEYKVNVFPTYLFFDPNGKLVHRAVGSSEAAEFITKAKGAIDPERQYYTLLEQFRAGKRDPDFLRRASYSVQEAYDPENTKMISAEYLKTQSDLFTKENIEYIDKFTGSTEDQGFDFIMKNQSKFDEVKGKGAAHKKLVQIIKYTDLFPSLFKDQKAPDWNAVTAAYTAKYPKQADEAITAGKVVYYQNKRDWTNFEQAVQRFMKKYGSDLTPDELNNYAWAVFENGKDIAVLADAAEWSKRSFKDNNTPMFIDTYANILYRLGKKDEALTWEEKAVAAAPESEKKNYQEVVEKMKKGEKTWK